MVLFVIVASGASLAQRYHVRVYNEADGLANSFVLDLAQDSSGVLWIARRSGVSSYDGSTFTNYSAGDGLRLTSYAYLKIDEKQHVWALPEAGPLCISRHDGSGWKTICSPSRDDAPDAMAYSTLDVYEQNGERVILIGTVEDGLFTYRNGIWNHFTTVHGLPDNHVTGAVWFEGRMVVSTSRGLVRFDRGRFVPVTVTGTSWPDQEILKLTRSDNKLWMLGRNWMGWIAGNHFTPEVSGFQLVTGGQGRHCFLYPARNGKIFFGNIYIVNSYTPATGAFVLYDRRNSLISEGGTAVLLDREMNIWISGYRGITKIPSERFMVFTDKEGLFSTEVSAALQLDSNRFVFGHDAGLTFLDGRKITVFPLNHAKQYLGIETRVLDLCSDGAGGFWFAASNLGVGHVNNRREISWYGKSKGFPGIASSVVRTEEGRVYAAGISGIYQLKGSRFEPITAGALNTLPIRKLFLGSRGQIWIASISDGLKLMRGEEVISFRSADNPLANSIYSLYFDHAGVAWVGTAAGLYMVRDGAIRRADLSGQSVTRPVYLVIGGSKQDLWCGTDNGVYRWKGGNLNHFTVSDGLSGQEVNRSAGLLDHQGRLWFGTNNGITVFDPAFDYQPKGIPPPKVSLQFVLAGKDTLDAITEHKLNYTSNDLTYHARVISLINEKQVMIRYYLEGFDTGWSAPVPYTGNQFVYANLRAGTYRFHLMACNSLGLWGDPVVSAPVIIRQPLFLRWWTLLVVALILLAMVLFSLRYILMIRYKNRLEQEVRMRTSELLDSEKKLKASNAAKDSFFSIIAHDLRNPFNVILGYLDLLTEYNADYSETEKKQILYKLKSASVRTIDLLENLLTWARSQRGNLPFEPQHFKLSEVVAENTGLMENAAHVKKIQLSSEIVCDAWIFADRNMINTVVRNLVSNAIKFTFPGGHVKIEVKCDLSDKVLLTVRDNGTGIGPEILGNLFLIEQRICGKGTANETGTGLGLILCKDFVERNQGCIWVESEQGRGTTFSVSLPVSEPIFNKLSTVDLS